MVKCVITAPRSESGEAAGAPGAPSGGTSHTKHVFVVETNFL